MYICYVCFVNAYICMCFIEWYIDQYTWYIYIHCIIFNQHFKVKVQCVYAATAY